MKNEQKKALVEELRKHYETVYPRSKDMVDYCTNQASVIVKLSNGMLIEIKKESIKTKFYFGYGHFGEFNDYREALNASAEAEKSAEYFVQENMEKYQRLFDEASKENSFALYHTYSESNPIMGIHFWYCTADRFAGSELYYPTKEDRDAILSGIEEAMTIHRKKIESYLKRYGLSKVDAHTYWADR